MHLSCSSRAYLDLEVTLSSEAFHNYVNAAMVHVNRALKLIIRLFLVEDLVDSLKVGVSDSSGGEPGFADTCLGESSLEKELSLGLSSPS